MRLPKAKRQGFRDSRNRDQVDVIGHQAPSEDADVIPPGVVAEHVKIADPVLVREENGLPIVAALSYVMSGAGKHESRSARHAG